jgi:hypothetical protein
MATLSETIWVRDSTELDTTVRNLVARGGQVQAQDGQSVRIYLKKTINVPVLVVLFLLCVVPGLVYLVWYLSADQNQDITVRIGTPANLGVPAGDHWYEPRVAPTPGAAPGADATPGAGAGPGPSAEPPAGTGA